MACSLLENMFFFKTGLVILTINIINTEMMRPYMLPIPPNNHGIQPTVLIDKETKLYRNNLLTIIPILSTEWSVSLNIRIESFGNDFWYSLMKFTNNPSKNDVEHGNRTPFIAVRPGQKLIYIYSTVNGNPNYYNLPGAFNVKVNQTYHIEIHQRYIANGEYRFYYIVDGVELHSVVNTDARQFYNVHVYASGPHYTEADAYISNFKYVNFL